MCMEDEKIGRNLVSTITRLLVPGGVSLMVTGKPDRVRLIVSSDGVQLVTLGTADAKPTITNGITLSIANPIIVIDDRIWGSLVKDEWWISDHGAGSTVVIVEVFLHAQKSSDLR